MITKDHLAQGALNRRPGHDALLEEGHDAGQPRRYQEKHEGGPSNSQSRPLRSSGAFHAVKLD
jgi:hypothetical protein